MEGDQLDDFGNERISQVKLNGIQSHSVPRDGMKSPMFARFGTMVGKVFVT